MRIVVRTLLSIIVAAAAAGVAPALSAQPVSGTYELALCRAAPCAPTDTAAAYLIATVVLLDSAAAARHGLPRPRYEQGSANGCFRIRHSRRLGDSYAWISGTGEFRWRPVVGSPGALTFALYRSPDASYDVQLSPTTGGLAGWGNSGGVGVADITAPRDTVVAVRVSDAALAHCQ